MMRRVLIIAYDFPPRGGSGVQRTVKFVKYLEDFGWRSTVIAPDWEDGTRDGTLEKELPRSAEVIREGVGGPASNRLDQMAARLPGLWRIRNVIKHNFRFPDVAAHWAKGALKAAMKRVGEGGIDVLYSTSPPVTPHLVAMQLATATGLPWIADFRDPWTDCMFYGRKLFGWRKRRDLHLEHQFSRTADRIVANTEVSRKAWIEKHDACPERVITIRNGYDEGEFPQSVAEKPRDIFRISYCGAAYGEYTPAPFAAVLRRFLTKRPDARVEWTIAGGACRWAEREMSDEPLLSKMNLRGYLPHADAVRLMASSHLLVQVLPVGAQYCVPGKLYEYLRSGTPIAAICDVPSEVSTILEDTGRGRAFRHDESDAMVSFLESEYRRWERGETIGVERPAEGIEQYDRRNLTGRLAEVFDRVTKGSAANGWAHASPASRPVESTTNR